MIVDADEATIAEAARLLREGSLVAFPTETVYGLGADATNGIAVAKIFEAKGRPRFNPLIVHVADLATARDYAEFDDFAARLAQVFWPGPLTLVLPALPRSSHRIHDLVTAGLNTIAIRVPAHPVAQKLLQNAAVPIAAPSANRSGHVSATMARHVHDDLGEAVSMILDGGLTYAGVESTIIATQPIPTLLRLGVMERSVIEAVLGCGLAYPHEATVRSPGQLLNHYAPRARVRLNAERALPGEILLAFGPGCSNASLNLSPTGDLRQAAANLFAYLRALDADNPSQIAVMPIPDTGLGEAINDRLRRASYPRQ